VRILIGIVHDAYDGHAVAADLARYVAVEILGRDNGEPIFSGKGGTAEAETECEGEAGKRGFHGEPVSQ
jgi:hypothetical protein